MCIRDRILGIKEMPLDFFKPGLTYMFFAHVIKGQEYNMDMLRKMMELGCGLMDYERVVDDNNRRLVFFGKYAGLAGMLEGLYTLGKRLELEGVQTPLAALKRPLDYDSLGEAKAALEVVGKWLEADGLPESVSPLVVGFAGYGNVSQGAQEIFDILPHEDIAPANLAGFIEKGESSRNKLYKVVFYEKADWELVDTPDSLVVPAPSGTLYFGDATFDATFTIPQDQAPGLYEGAITVDDGAHTTLIPVTVNVAVPPEDLLFTLGDAAEAGTPYDNGRTTGGWTWYSVYEEGDWRFFYYDADAGFEQQYLYVRNQWGKVQYDMPTAYETLVWGPNPGDSFSKKEPGKYGPYGLRFAGGTWDAYGPQDGWGSPRRGTWWVDGDGITRPENRVWATLWDGLNQVQFRNILNSGKQVGEDFDATAGVFGVDADVIVIEATEPSGSFTFDAVSPVDGLWVEAKGFVEPEWFRGLEALVDIPQGTDQTNFPPNDLLNGWVHEFEVQDSDYVQADLFGPWASDADLYLLFDQNHDGIFAVPGEVVAQSTLGGSNENIFYADPLAGDYAVVIYGYDLRPGDLFDLRLETGAGASDGLVVEAEEGYWYEPQVLNATPGVPQEITVHWEVPGTGLWEADVDFCMPWDENPRQPMGPCIDLDVVVNYGGSLIEVEKEIYLFEGTQPMTQTVYSEDLQQWLYEAEELLVKDVDELEWMDLCTQPIQGEPEQHIFLYHVSVTNNGDREVDIELHDILPEGTRFYNARWQVTTEDWTTTNHMRGNPIAAAYWGDGSFADHLEVDNGFLEIVGGGLPFYHLQPKDPVQGAMNFLFLVEVDRNYSGEIVNTADVYVDVWLPFTQYHTRVSDSAVVTIYDCQTLYLPLVVRQ